jgi:hypothetical protein
MPKSFPDSYVQTPTGDILMADGMNPVKRWDGLKPAPIDAGLVGPTDEVTLAPAGGVGTILGTYAAYIRWLDEDFNVSNLSPISLLLQFSGPGGDVIGATNTAPIRITTSAPHGLSTGHIVSVEGVQGNTGGNATWQVNVASATEFDLNGSSGDGAYSGGGTWTPGADAVNYTSVPVPTDPKVTRKQILRNTEGQLTTFYVDVDTDDLAGTSFTSTFADNELATQEAVPLLSVDGAPLANAHYPPPNFMESLASHSSRVFAAVNRAYSEGAVKVTDGSATVTGIGTFFTNGLVGRYLFVNGATKKYEIASVDSVLSLTLAEAYDDTTSEYAVYSIRPEDGQRRLIWYTQAGQPYSWSPLCALEIQEDGDELTGLMTKGSFLYILEQRHIYRFTFQSDPAIDGYIYQSCQRGVVNNRCWVQVEDATYMLDKDGIHAFGGGQESEQISSAIQRIFQTLEESDHVINWNGRDLFHAAHYPQEEVIRWFVSMGSASATRHAIALQYRTKRWWLEEYPIPITCSALGLIGLARVVFLGSSNLRTIVGSVGYLDGIDKNSGTLVGAVSVADICSLSDYGAGFPVGIVGLPVVITSGKGKLQRRIIHEVDGIRLKVTQPWRIIPDSTSTYQIGGIKYKYRSKIYEWADGEQEMKRKLGVFFEPSSELNYSFFRLYQNASKTPVVFRANTFGNPEGVSGEDGSPELIIDMSKAARASGYAQQRMESSRDDDIDGVRQWFFELVGVSGPRGAFYYSFLIDGVRGG